MTILNALTTLRVPVIGAPMFLISTPKLVIAQCKAGIVGSFPSLNARSPEQLRDWIRDIKLEIEGYNIPFAVNLVALNSNKRFMQDLDICIQEKVPIIITSMHAPHNVVEAVHSYGGLHFHDVINQRHAEKAIETGVDGLICVCAGAGGHAGTLHPYAFIKAVRHMFDGIILLAGSISTGADVFANRIIGADFSYIGSRFIATKEANADHDYKEMCVNASAEDIIYTPQFTGVNASFLKDSIRACGFNPETVLAPQYKKPSKLLLWWKHKQLRSKRWKDLWSAGQSVQGITDIVSVNDYVTRLKEEYDAAKSLASSL